MGQAVDHGGGLHSRTANGDGSENIDPGHPIHGELAGAGESLQIEYQCSASPQLGTVQEDVVRSFQELLDQDRREEIARGVSRIGPHRDDLRLLIADMDAGPYASRGQARTLALALRLAEARYLAEARGQEPVLLLDDVLSELDAARRRRVLEASSHYQQTMITTTHLEHVHADFLSEAVTFKVRSGTVE